MRQLLLILFLFCISILSAQNLSKEKRVFLWDVSESLIMKKSQGGTEMWEELKTSLKDAISYIEEDKQSRIVLVPFYTHPLEKEIIDVPATKEGKQRIMDFIDKRKCEPDGLGSKTCIVRAIQKFHSLASSDYCNYMYLYTDGREEVLDLCAELSAWNEKLKLKECFGFYVLVAPEAENECIRNAAKTQDNIEVVEDAKQHIVHCKINSAVCDVRKSSKVRLKVTGNIADFNGAVKLESQSNDYYSVRILQQNIKEGYIDVEVLKKSKDKLPDSFSLKVNVSKIGGDKYSKLGPDVITIKCLNKPIRTLNISIK